MNRSPLPDLTESISETVRLALAEDIGPGDATAALIPADRQLETRVISRQTAIFCGRKWFTETCRQVEPAVRIDWRVDDGDPVRDQQLLCQLQGPARAILSAERTGLNFLQTLSATATLARQYVDAVAGTGVTILDTRKTLPGLRLAQKYAVRCGGAGNHRTGLYDAILIKENHIAAAGDIHTAVNEARRLYPDLLLEVEVENLAELQAATAAGARRALLDNFDLPMLRQAVTGYKGKIELEASGGVDLHSIRAIAETGVDYISVGDITKNVQAVDLSMRFVGEQKRLSAGRDTPSHRR